MTRPGIEPYSPLANIPLIRPMGHIFCIYFAYILFRKLVLIISRFCSLQVLCETTISKIKMYLNKALYVFHLK